MKFLLFIPFLFICNMAVGQVWGTQPYPAADSKKTTFVNGLEWHQQPYGYDVNWADARERCYGLGNGWRMPTSAELSAFYNAGGLGSSTTYLWTSTVSKEDSEKNYVAEVHYGGGSKWLYAGRWNKFKVWAVR